MTYKQAVDFLEGRERFGIRLGLDNMARLCGRLGNPERRLASFHIAGTNGKGSTARIIATILLKAGYRTGLYTSPHLLDTRERIQIDNRLISRADFASLITEIEPVITDLSRVLPHSPTYFETITAAAFLHFSRKNIDYAVVEVGMGGRLDATNLLNPLVSIITPIGLEHRHFLGKTLAAIAGEKAGIIKQGRPIVSAKQSLAALRVIKARAAEKKASVYLAGSPSPLPSPLRGEGRVRGLTISLPGQFQVENAAVACLALRAAGVEVKEGVLRSALKDISWPGRLQVVSRKPLIIFDVSHNPPAVKTLVANLAGLYPGRKTTFLFGVLEDKDYLSMLKYLGDYGERFFFTRPYSNRAREPRKLADTFRRVYQKKECRVIPEPKDAFREAVKSLGKDDLLCICGSFYLAPLLQNFKSSNVGEGLCPLPWAGIRLR
ncbi:MAG: folylpolyglutamate synthase/dihydrofolate synthase family protein [Candidatus Ratteibacteria bacterium]|jgi:dihydrofolate synthase/folylpolyglutamate synthase